jgi:flagellar protein FlgJ
MGSPSVTPSYYADFSGLEGLKAGARSHQKDALRETARQFESLLTRMMLKSMREASLGEGLGDSQETAFYQDMFDQQLAVQASKGEGLGLASRLMEQLQRTNAGAATTATTAALVPSGDESKRRQFVEQLRPAATQVAARLGVATEAVIAHAALESGWGAHLPADARGSSFNLFGIKASGGFAANAVNTMTTEVSNGGSAQLLQAFRRYDSVPAGLQDYSALLSSNARYAGALHTGNDINAFAQGLQRGGYATDPDYAQKLVATAVSVRQLLSTSSLKNGESLPITRQPDPSARSI